MEAKGFILFTADFRKAFQKVENVTKKTYSYPLIEALQPWWELLIG
jgi:hypothetical protein